ncbi:MAG TPA: hypothetical protein DCS07_04045 [Bdellovibrionales bacterium]|nr:MAG: hypothetical protein A2Z97_11850 [Bdellovibrionales bacterium GWB1_52_6]OFZ05347.1 MAG: hypothetical protein A2X97_16505 [Bdellovibrionales bacterium GWA1_52_35]OFZ43317.1 MAG: hypothetical protein A2070_02815 [Bdellovibrionales bacterium GWC1_52_8]HAR41789.1 hypothetical protein [Bdellovibrionales bacterium]HCM39012.1 hypothetical protein [Bdellovibrionales bacterium]
MKTIILLFLLAVSFTTGLAEASVMPANAEQSSVELEGQVLWQGRNDAAIPGDTGTRFSLREILKSSTAGFRLEASYPLSERSQLRGVFAPLTIQDSGTLLSPVSFQGSSFNTTEPIETIFKFNSYRLTYRYRFIQNDDWTLFAGLTAKVRDAKISLRQGSAFQEKANLGFVPLLYCAAAYHFNTDWQAELEFDALAAPQGRAEDLRLALRKNFSVRGLSAALGYRILEGGADNKTVFTFALFHYATASVGFEF